MIRIDLEKLEMVIVVWPGPDSGFGESGAQVSRKVLAYSLGQRASFPTRVFSHYHGATRELATELVDSLSGRGNASLGFVRTLEAPTRAYATGSRVLEVDTAIIAAASQRVSTVILCADSFMAHAYASRLAELQMGWELDGAREALTGEARIPNWNTAHFDIKGRRIELLPTPRLEDLPPEVVEQIIPRVNPLDAARKAGLSLI